MKRPGDADDILRYYHLSDSATITYSSNLGLRERKIRCRAEGKDLCWAESNHAPQTNKRFLTSIIKSTDDRNKAVLKAQAVAAQEIKREREEQERRERSCRGY